MDNLTTLWRVATFILALLLLPIGGFAGCSQEDGEDGTQATGYVPKPQISLNVDPPEKQIIANGQEEAIIKIQVLDTQNNAVDDKQPLTLTTTRGWFKLTDRETKIIINPKLNSGRYEVAMVAYSGDQGTATVEAVANVENRVIKASSSILILPDPKVIPSDDDDDDDVAGCSSSADCQTGLTCCDGVCKPSCGDDPPCFMTLLSSKEKIKGDGNSTAEISAYAADGNGETARGANISFTVTGAALFMDGSTETAAGTDNSGFANVTIRSIQHSEGQATVQAKYICDASTGPQDIIRSITVIVEEEDPPPATLEVRCSPNLILSNGKDISECVVVVRDQDGIGIDTKVSCEASKGTWTGTNRNKIEVFSDADGITTVMELMADTVPETSMVTCQVEVPNSDGAKVKVTGTTTVRMVSRGQLMWESTNPYKLGLTGSGNETAKICFLLVDGDNIPIENIAVQFRLTDAPGGPFIYPDGLDPKVYTDTNGRVCTTLNTGKVPTTVQVIASASTGTAALQAHSPPIIIAGGLPSSRYFSFYCVPNNVGGLSTMSRLQTTPCVVTIADRFGNPIGANVPIFFRTEAGTISAASYTEVLMGDNTAAMAILTINNPMPRDVDPIAGEPFYKEANGRIRNPRDGLVTIIAATTGEEEFFDENGNGVYDPGERFVDLSEPFVDSNDNGTWDVDEEFIDVNGNLTWDPPNGQWDGDTIIWTSTRVLWTDDLIANKQGCVQNDIDQTKLQTIDQLSFFCPSNFDIQDPDLNPNELKIGNGGSREVTFQFRDKNLNPPNSSTVITAFADVNLAAHEFGSGVQVPDMLGMDVNEVVECGASKICTRRHEISNFYDGYRGSFIVRDSDPAIENARQGPIKMTATYKSVPPIQIPMGPDGGGGGQGGDLPTLVLELPLQAKMDVSDVTGPCSMKLTLSTDFAPADGRTLITVSARARNANDQPLTDSSIRLSATAGRFQQSQTNTAIVRPDANGIVEVQYIVPNTPPTDNEVIVSAGFICDGAQISRAQRIVIYENIVPEASVTLSVSKSTVVANGEDFVEVSAFVTDSDGKKVKDGTVVAFHIRTPTGARLFVDPDNPLVDENDPDTWLPIVNNKQTKDGQTKPIKLMGGGEGGCRAGIIEVEAIVTDPVDATDRQVVNAIKMGSIEFDKDGAPSYLTAFGSGLKETAPISFTVNDTNGNPFSPKTSKTSGQLVQFDLYPKNLDPTNPSPANPQLLVAQGYTDAMGIVSTLVKSGTVATNFVVTATAKFTGTFYSRGICEDEDIVSQSMAIPVVGAIPNARYMTFECKDINLPGIVTNFIDSNCTLTLADRFSNIIGIKTNVSYRIEAGHISPFSMTPEFPDPEVGKTQVNWRTGNPQPLDVPPQYSPFLESREPYYIFGNNFQGSTVTKVYNPRDGLVTVIAATTGEEEFFDTNGNGRWDLGEDFIDLPEPFVDSNDNNLYDSDEMFLDANGNMIWDKGNNVWDANTLIWTSYKLLWTGKPTPIMPIVKTTNPAQNPGSVVANNRWDYSAQEMCTRKMASSIPADFVGIATTWPEAMSVKNDLYARQSGSNCEFTLPNAPIFHAADVGKLFIGIDKPDIYDDKPPKRIKVKGDDVLDNFDYWFKVVQVLSPTQVVVEVGLTHPNVNDFCPSHSNPTPCKKDADCGVGFECLLTTGYCLKSYDWVILNKANPSGNNISSICANATNPVTALVHNPGTDYEHPGLAEPWTALTTLPGSIFFQVENGGSDTFEYNIMDIFMNTLNPKSTVVVETTSEAVTLSGHTSVTVSPSLSMDTSREVVCGTVNIRQFDPTYTCTNSTKPPIDCDHVCRVFYGIGNFRNILGEVNIKDAFGPPELDGDPPVADADPAEKVDIDVIVTVPAGSVDYGVTKTISGSVD